MIWHLDTQSTELCLPLITYSVSKLQLHLDPLGCIGRLCTYSHVLLDHTLALECKMNLKAENVAIYIYRLSYFTWHRTNEREWDHKGNSIQKIFKTLQQICISFNFISHSECVCVRRFFKNNFIYFVVFKKKKKKEGEVSFFNFF